MWLVTAKLYHCLWIDSDVQISGRLPRPPGCAKLLVKGLGEFEDMIVFFLSTTVKARTIVTVFTTISSLRKPLVRPWWPLVAPGSDLVQQECWSVKVWSAKSTGKWTSSSHRKRPGIGTEYEVLLVASFWYLPQENMLVMWPMSATMISATSMIIHDNTKNLERLCTTRNLNHLNLQGIPRGLANPFTCQDSKNGDSSPH